jgi:peptidoglycan/xylan/chitin deacetylase (PgdA/CDA1 family)
MGQMSEHQREAGCTCCRGSGWINRRTLLGLGLSLIATPSLAALTEPVLMLPLDRGVQKPLALTLDACSGGVDQTLLKGLIVNRIPATIFVTGLWLKRNRPAVAEIMAHPHLFQIGNHGARHHALILADHAPYGQKSVGTIERARQEVMEGADLIQDIFGVRPRWFRGATALYSPEILPMIEAWGFHCAGYSLNADGGASLPAASVVARMARARPGQVILGHINHPEKSSGAGLLAGARQLVDQGFTFTTLEGAILVKNH